MVYHTSRCRSKPLASALLSPDLSSTLSSEHGSEGREVGGGGGELQSEKKNKGIKRWRRGENVGEEEKKERGRE